MARIVIDTTKGQYTNTDEFASGQPGQIVNLMVDEHGTLTSRPGLLAWVQATDAVDGLAGSNDQNIIGLFPYLDYLVAVNGQRRVKLISSNSAVTDITDDYLAGWKRPKFLIDDDGSLLIFGGGAPLRIDGTLRARRFAVGLEGQPTHGAIADHVLLVNDDGSDYVYFSDVGLTSGHENFVRVGGQSTPGVFRAGTRADPITAMAALQNRVLIFGEQSVEAFYGTGLG